jgi:hypothetical protein
VHLIRILLRIVAVAALAVAAYLVVWQPKATVASVSLGTPINVSVQCSSLYNQWTHHAQPASLNLNSTRLVPLPAAQKACDSGSSKIKKIDAGLVIGAAVAMAVSIVFRRRR